MTFLKKLGSVLAKGLQIAVGVSPFIQGKAGEVAQKVISELEQLISVITSVETFGQLTGLPGIEKLKAAGPLVGQVILQSAFMVGKKIAKPELFQQAMTKIADGLADFLNSLHEDAVKTEDKA